jgi:hypothetical protein
MPQILRFLSADPLASKAPSDDMSIVKTGSLCPYSDTKNFKESEKNTCASKQPSKEGDQDVMFQQIRQPNLGSERIWILLQHEQKFHHY